MEYKSRWERFKEWITKEPDLACPPNLPPPKEDKFRPTEKQSKFVVRLFRWRW